MNSNQINELVIFDFDGVIVNTEHTTFSYYKELLPSYGIHLTENDFKYKMGRKSIDFFKDVLGDKFDQKLVDEVIQKKRQAFLQDIKKYVVPISGIFDLLEGCRKSNFRMAIGSQNEKPLIQKAVDVFGIRSYFEFMTSMQDIKNKKPDPEVFFLVTNTMGVAPSKAVVIEDAPAGIKAAKVGGFKAIGLTTSHSKDELKEADMVIDSLKDITAEFLRVF